LGKSSLIIIPQDCCYARMYDQMHDGEKDFPKSHLNVNEQNLFFCHNEEELDKKY
jgi:hypothetical protein